MGFIYGAAGATGRRAHCCSPTNYKALMLWCQPVLCHFTNRPEVCEGVAGSVRGAVVVHCWLLL